MAILRARQINQWGGGKLVGPWDLEEEPEKYAEWIETIDALSEGPAMARRKQRRDEAQRAFFAKQDQEHPTYGKFRQ